MISIFAKPWYVEEVPGSGPYLRRVSSRVRGQEIAEYLGARYNPTDGYADDVRIYVKPRGLRRVKAGAWIDVLDDRQQVEWLRERPDLRVIAMSQAHAEHLRRELPEHRVVLIPHHHLNFERFRRVPGERKVYGFVGSYSAHSVRLQRRVGVLLAERGLEYRPLLNFATRQDVTRYYQTIDVQLIAHFGPGDETSPWSHPTRLVNAASFGIPTICPRLPGYREVEGYYTAVASLEELVEEAVRMQDADHYAEVTEDLTEVAELYRISFIATLYRGLD